MRFAEGSDEAPGGSVVLALGVVTAQPDKASPPAATAPATSQVPAAPNPEFLKAADEVLGANERNPESSRERAAQEKPPFEAGNSRLPDPRGKRGQRRSPALRGRQSPGSFWPDSERLSARFLHAGRPHRSGGGPVRPESGRVLHRRLDSRRRTARRDVPRADARARGPILSHRSVDQGRAPERRRGTRARLR